MSRSVSMQFGKPGGVVQNNGADQNSTAQLNPTSISPTNKVSSCEELNLVRKGSVVQVSGNVKMASNATGTYTDHTAFTGAPSALVTGGEQMMGGVVIWDGGNVTSAVYVNGSGEVVFRARNNAITSRQGVFFVTYIAQ